jgi:hypothetical protein
MMFWLRALWGFISNPANIVIVGIIAIVGFGSGYFKGKWHAEEHCQTAELKAEIAKLKLEAKVQADADAQEDAIAPSSWPKSRKRKRKMPRSFKRFVSVLTSACLALTLAACDPGRPTPDNPGLNIPNPPSYLEPVTVPYGTAETDARELAVQRRLTIDEANGRIVRGKAAWLKMKRGFAGKGKPK